MKVYLLGLDGFDRRIFNKLDEENAIPNLSRLIKEGIWGDLNSTIPPYTGPAWVSMLTGVNPGKHGIFGFSKTGSGAGECSLNSSLDIKTKKLWDILNEQNLRSGFFNVPLTFPPGNINGFMVTGMMTPSNRSKFYYPDDLFNAMGQKQEEYIIDVPVNFETQWRNQNIIKKIEQELIYKKDLLLKLIKKHDPTFMMAVFVAPDRLQHLWYDFIMKEGSYHKLSKAAQFRSSIIECYSLLDRAIAELTSTLSDDDYVIIVSDHGFTSLKKTFYLNNVLLENGYLHLKGKGEKQASFISRFNQPWIKKMVPHSLIVRLKKAATSGSIDMGQTRAYASPGMMEGLFLNVENDDERKRILDSLSGISDEGNGNVILECYNKEDIYKGPNLEGAPDVVFKFAAGYGLSETIGGDLFRDYTNIPAGGHAPKGIFAINNIGSSKKDVRKEADIYDIYPTVLNLLKIPEPADLDGKDILNSTPASNNIDKKSVLVDKEKKDEAFSRDEEEQMKDKLKGLGYF